MRAWQATMGAWRRMVVDTRPLQHGPYRRLWGAMVVTAVGGTLTVVAVPLQVYQLTGSSAYVGLAAFVGFAPMVAFALWGGAVADAVDRRRLLLVTEGGLAFTSVLLWAQAAAGLRSVAVLLVLVGLQQAFAGASHTVHSASVPRLVPLRLLPAAHALGATVRQFGMVAGPLLAGALIPLVGLGVLYFIEAVALTVAVWMVRGLPDIPPRAQAPRRAGLRQLGDGFAYLTGQRILLVALLADGIAMVLGMPAALYPQLAQETFGDPPGGGPALGALFAAWPLGYVLGGLLSGVVTRSRRYGVMVTAAVSGWGLTVAGLGVARDLWLAVALLTLGGAACFVLMVFRSSILQAVTTDELRGRMEGVLTVVTAGGPRVGGLAYGVAGAALGTTWAVSGGGVLVVAAMVATVLAVPAFWRYRAPVAPRPDG